MDSGHLLLNFWIAAGLFFQAMKMKQTGMAVAMMPRPIAGCVKYKLIDEMRLLLMVTCFYRSGNHGDDSNEDGGKNVNYRKYQINLK